MKKNQKSNNTENVMGRLQSFKSHKYCHWIWDFVDLFAYYYMDPLAYFV